jgi:hypothetical protein
MRLAILSLVAVLAGCNSPAAPGLGDQFTLRVGESAALTELGLSIQFTRVVDDSRCPANAVCVWQGDGAVLLEISPLNGDANSKESVLHTSVEPHSIPVGRAELRLVKLDPYPAAPGSIDPNAYVVTLTTRLAP